MVFHIVCSYCGKEMGTKEAESNGVAETLEEMGLKMVSHSICPSCFKKEMAKIHSRREEDDNE